ncbi:MAG: c-type cytochrome [Gallionellaceae bacterium]|nr:c-type cytochrome [Gallionellaceae bacterium]
MLASGVASAAPNASNGKTIFENGKGDEVQPCLTCHMDRAQGSDDMGAPRLAGIGYGYVVKQLTNFADDKRVPEGLGAVMPGFAKALTPQERTDVAAYVNSIKDEPELSDLKALAEAGNEVGDASKGYQLVMTGAERKTAEGRSVHVAACSACHDYNGRGVDPVFPKIGQQKYTYLVNQLQNWKSGARANDPSAIMRNVAKNLTDEDIHNVAAYLSKAPPTRGGGDAVPNNDSLLHGAH